MLITNPIQKSLHLNDTLQKQLTVGLRLDSNHLNYSLPLKPSDIGEMQMKSAIEPGAPVVGMLFIGRHAKIADVNQKFCVDKAGEVMRYMEDFAPRKALKKLQNSNTVSSPRTEDENDNDSSDDDFSDDDEEEDEEKYKRTDKGQYGTTSKKVSSRAEIAYCLKSHKSLFNLLPQELSDLSIRLYENFEKESLVDIWDSDEAMRKATMARLHSLESSPVSHPTLTNHYTCSAMIRVAASDELRQADVLIRVEPIVPHTDWSGRLYGLIALERASKFCSSTRSEENVRELVREMKQESVFEQMREKASEDPNNPVYIDALMSFVGAAYTAKEIIPSFPHLYSVFRAQLHNYGKQKGFRGVMNDEGPMPVIITIMQKTEFSLKEFWIEALKNFRQEKRSDKDEWLYQIPPFSFRMMAAHIFQIVFVYAKLQALNGFIHNAEDPLSAIRVKFVKDEAGGKTDMYYCWNGEYFSIPTNNGKIKLTNFFGSTFIDSNGVRFVAMDSTDFTVEENNNNNTKVTPQNKLPYHHDLAVLGNSLQEFICKYITDSASMYNVLKDKYFHLVDTMTRNWQRCVANPTSPHMCFEAFEKHIQMIHNTKFPVTRKSISNDGEEHLRTSVPAFQQPYFEGFRTKSSLIPKIRKRNFLIFEHRDFMDNNTVAEIASNSSSLNTQTSSTNKKNIETELTSEKAMVTPKDVFNFYKS